MQIRRWAILILISLAASGPARADNWGVCANSSEEEAAIAACSRLLARGGMSAVDRATVYTNRGAAYLNVGDYDLALKDLNEAVHLDGESGHAYYNRGTTFFFRNEPEKAIVDLSRALRLRPTAKTYLFRGRAYLALNRRSEAIHDFTAGLTYDPDYAELYYRRGQAFHEGQDYTSALADYTQALSRRSKRADWFNDRADVLLKLGRPEPALADADHALQLEPRRVDALAKRGEALEAMGRDEQARAAFESALQIDPVHEDAVAGLSRLGDRDKTKSEKGNADDEAVDEVHRPAERTRETRPTAQEHSNTPRPLDGISLPGQQLTSDLATARALLTAYNTSGLELLDTLVKSQRESAANIAISAYSIGTVMAMATYGASGDTEQEMRRALQHTLPRKDLPGANLLATRLLTERPVAVAVADERTAIPAFSLTVANAIAMGPNAAQFAPSYVTALKENFAAAVQQNATSESINAWVRDQTGGRISALVDNLNSESMALLNAVTMQARWAAPFVKHETRDAPFVLAGVKQVPVQTMHQEGEFAVTEWQGLRAIKLPYAEQDMAMLVIVPEDPGRFVRRGIEVGRFDQLFAKLAQAKTRKVYVALPRFKVETAADLVPAFTELGIRHAFQPGAEFDYMTGANGASPYIGAIRHKAVVVVDELGTEASAASAVIMRPGEAQRTTLPELFAVDRPFLFIVVDYRSGAMLFMGRVTDPRDS
jgi:serpin B